MQTRVCVCYPLHGSETYILMSYSGSLCGSLCGAYLSWPSFPSSFLPPSQILWFYSTPCFRDISCSSTCLCHHLSCSSTWPSSLSLFPPTHPSPGWNVIFSGKPETCLKAPPYRPKQIKLPFLSLHTSSLTLLFSAPIPHSDLHNLCFCPSLPLESVIPLGLGVLLTSFLQIP